MLLHGDIFLNENTELRVGVSYRYCGVIIHKCDLFFQYLVSGLDCVKTEPLFVLLSSYTYNQYHKSHSKLAYQYY